MDWKRLLAYITSSVDQELLLRNEYLVTENRILRDQLQSRLRLTDSERINLAEIGKRLGRKALDEVAQIVRPENHPELAPKTGRQEVRRLKEPFLSTVCGAGRCSGGPGASIGQAE